MFFRSKGIDGDVDTFNWDRLRRNTKEMENLQKDAVRKFRERNKQAGPYSRPLGTVYNPPAHSPRSFNRHDGGSGKGHGAGTVKGNRIKVSWNDSGDGSEPRPPQSGGRS